MIPYSCLVKRPRHYCTYQESDLVPAMNAVENIFVGNEKTRFAGLIDFQEMLEYVVDLMDRYEIQIDPLPDH